VILGHGRFADRVRLEPRFNLAPAFERFLDAELLISMIHRPLARLIVLATVALFAVLLRCAAVQSELQPMLEHRGADQPEQHEEQ